ncbi:MAG: pilus biosynthesis protein TapB [Gammaproteobacteria bacterium]|nr:MAG: type IV-A pilus assembly ATPase PilB [Pseudomonadota bacterium]MBC6944699.1 type IV-A pilus assembly ATPase PilB [Gammaproteobacteria bacterium]MCE7897318.1 type IV-A pilus assembly ATPase PilB [Gammaproteobacteria bacterium PRO8]MDL1881172.1 type IV-A pilus assembly ATPase PilB [Gammaproteobacteria bacterium PRO2]MCL4778489.1 type IV-A pilus assembly ATPase PilB [Gammaproteobacteria bacterium]
MAINPSTPMLSGLSRRLVQDGIVAEETVLAAIQASKADPGGLVPYLVARNLADPRQVAIAAASEFGVPLLDLDAMETDLDAFKAVDRQLVSRHRVLPLLLRGKRLFLGMADPTNLQAIDEIKFQTSFRVDPVVVEQDKLEQIVARTLDAVDTSMGNMADDDFDLESLEVTGGDEDVADEPGRDDTVDAPVVRFVNKVLLDAIKRGASDIHFEPYEKIYRVRTRLDGVLKQVAAPPLALSSKVVARLKVMARLDIAERRLPQDGRIKMKLSKNRAIDFRVNTCPTLFGEKVVLRILDPSSAKLGIDALGYEDQQKKAYLDALAKPYGMILVTGPTGSGKTVSLYTGLNILNTEDRNISTAEDPAEINMPGVNQVNVNPKVGLTFAAALRAFLRQDPDVIMVGEIRDLETAEIAIKAAQTGHLVLSTVHTNDAPKTLSRLVDMGVKPYAIASSVHLIIAQRLARRLCESCKEIKDIPEEALLQEGFTKQDVHGGLRIYGPVGCKSCTDGYKGRVGIYQVMPITESISRIILEGGSAQEIAEQASKDGIWDLRRSALQKVKDGVTSLEEINRVTID